MTNIQYKILVFLGNVYVNVSSVPYWKLNLNEEKLCHEDNFFFREPILSLCSWLTYSFLPMENAVSSLNPALPWPLLPPG